MRTALIAGEPAVAPLLILLAVAWAGWRAVARAGGDRGRMRDARRADQKLALLLARFGWAPAVLLWLLPLWSHWAGWPPDAHAEWLAPLGHIPWSDGYAYYEGTQQLLWDGRFGHFAEQKPIFPALFAVMLVATRGSVPAALFVRGVLLGVASLLAARQVGLRYGTSCAVASFALLLGLGRGVVPAVVTDPLGYVFGCLSVAVLLSTAARRRVDVFTAGLFLLALALQVRPGAQLVLPALVIWAMWHFGRRRRVVLACAVTVVLAANLVTTVLNRCYGAGESSFYARPAFYLYGLAHGSTEDRASADFSAQASQFANEGAFARFVYAQALSEVRRNPGTLLVASAKGMGRLVEKAFEGFVYVSNVARILAPPAERMATTRVTWPGKVVVALLAVTALARVGRSRERGFWLAVAAGTLASGMFIGTNIGFHGVAAVYPLLTLALTLGLARGSVGRRLLRTAARREERRVLRGAIGLGVVLVFVTVAGPAWARRAWVRPTTAVLMGMQPGRDIVLLRDTSPTVVVGAAGMPLRKYRDLIELGGTEMGVVEPPPPFSVLSAWDFVARRQVVLYAPVEVAGLHGFVHLLVEEEARAANQQAVVRAGDWSVMGAWE